MQESIAECLRGNRVRDCLPKSKIKRIRRGNDAGQRTWLALLEVHLEPKTGVFRCISDNEAAIRGIEVQWK